MIKNNTPENQENPSSSHVPHTLEGAAEPQLSNSRRLSRILFATGNAHKLEEVRKVLSHLPYEIISLKDLGIEYDIPETGDTLEENATIKSKFLAERYPDYHIISEDTGLEIDALDGAPGVITARYGGPERDAQQNMDKVLSELSELSDNVDRSGQFRTIISHIYQGVETQHEGIVRGRIATEQSGKDGFGYDPIFIPEGNDESFADLGDEIKMTMSHRSRAVAKLVKSLGSVSK